MGIEDFEITSGSKEKGIVHGYLGITKEISFRGVVSFLNKTDNLHIRSLELKLTGFLETLLTVDKKQYKENLLLVQKSTVLIDETVQKFSEHANLKKKVISFPKGLHEINFEILIEESICSNLLASFKTSPVSNEDESKIVYLLEATLILAQTGLFGGISETNNKKPITCVEEVDVPRIQGKNLIASENCQGKLVLQNSDDIVDYKINISNTVFGYQQPITVDIEYIRVRNGNIKSVEVVIRQHEVLRCYGNQKTFKPIIASPDLKPKFKIEKTKEYEECKFVSYLSVKEMSTTQKKNKKKKGETEPHQGFQSPLLNIYHVIEITCNLKGGKEIKIEAPCIFFEADESATKIVKNLDGELIPLEESIPPNPRKNDFHAPYNKLLCTEFDITRKYSVAPQAYPQLNTKSTIDFFVEYTIEVNIEPVLLLEINSPSVLKFASSRQEADEQLHNHCIEPLPIPSNPNLIIDTAPIERWNKDLMEKDGALHLKELFQCVIQMCETIG
ncbi:hypothetical protein HDU92_003367 [Lobulomyces angularis]|nr:hypothetical protein HDU92_003367 [Lobulomyces angularis]